MSRETLVNNLVKVADVVCNVSGTMIDMGLILTEGVAAGLSGNQGKRIYADVLILRAKDLGTASRGSRVPLMWLHSKEERRAIRSKIDEALGDFWRNEASGKKIKKII